MRHRKSINHLGRTSAHRKAMLSNLASSLILHKRITTTIAKAKALRMYVEPLITKAKDDSTHSRRIVFSFLQDKEAVTELFREVSKKVGDRPGGYTRILKLGQRLGDNADMAFMELVDYNENLLAVDEAAKGKSKRRRSKGSKKTEETEVAAGKSVKVDKKTEDKVEAVKGAETVVEDEAVVEPDVEETTVAETDATVADDETAKEDTATDTIEEEKK